MKSLLALSAPGGRAGDGPLITTGLIEPARYRTVQALAFGDPDRRVPFIRHLELLEICADLLTGPQRLSGN